MNLLSLVGPSSYKEHCHRMLRIWVDSLPPSVDAVQELTESLIAINKEKLAGIEANFSRFINFNIIIMNAIE